MKADFSSYLESWSKELTSRSNRVRNLIGDAHWLSDGHHKEYIIRDFLKRLLPNRIKVTTGFVRPLNLENKCSTEIDVLVLDNHLQPPFFSEGGIDIVPPTSCIAHLE